MWVTSVATRYRSPPRPEFVGERGQVQSCQPIGRRSFQLSEKGRIVELEVGEAVSQSDRLSFDGSGDGLIVQWAIAEEGQNIPDTSFWASHQRLISEIERCLVIRGKIQNPFVDEAIPELDLSIGEILPVFSVAPIRVMRAIQLEVRDDGSGGAAVLDEVALRWEDWNARGCGQVDIMILGKRPVALRWGGIPEDVRKSRS